MSTSPETDLARRRAAPVRGIVVACLLFSCLVTGAVADGPHPGEPVTAGPRDGSPVRRALLIGINRYQRFARLHGAINDIELVARILETRFGFRRDHIRMLRNEEATRRGILAALRKLIAEAGTEDIVYVHYAGHGSQVKDLNGDEKDDGMDETLVPQDGRTPGVADIVDDELEALLAGLEAKRAVIVLDSCHSGTATRGIGVVARSVPPDSREELYAVSRRAIVEGATRRYVLFTGAAAHQSALDGPCDGRRHGLFTYALCRSLGSGSRSLSWRQLHRGVKKQLGRLRAQLHLDAMPEPQLEIPDAAWLDRPIMPAAGSNDATRLPWAPVRTEGDRVRILDAARLSLAPGALLGVYPPGETRFRPGRARAVVRVLELDGGDALGRIESGSRAVPAESRAVLLAPARGGSRIPVKLGPGVQRPDRFAEALRRAVPAVHIVESGLARFVVDRTTKDGWTLSGPTGNQVLSSFRGDGDAAVSEIAAAIFRFRTAGEMMSLENPASEMRLEVRPITAAKEEREIQPVGGRGVRVRPNLSVPELRIREEGTPATHGNNLMLEVSSNEDAYITIVDVDVEGRVTVMFPNAHSEEKGFLPEGRVTGGTTVRIPDALENGNRAGFNWDVAPPAGIDTVRVFATRDPGTAALIREQIRALSLEGRGGKNALEKRLARLGTLQAKLASRGVRVRPQRPAPAEAADAPAADAPGSGEAVVDWTAATVTFKVVE